jgi:transcriptional regulator with GAF, ATPase, and Fis domain
MGMPQEEHLSSLLVEVWREACRHIEISESAPNLAAILARCVPISQLLIRRIDQAKLLLETVAIGCRISENLLPDARSESSPKVMQRILNWAADGRVINCDEQADLEEWVRTLIPRGVQGNILAGPLGGVQHPQGVLILVASGGVSFNKQHERIAGQILDPLSTALENDRRLREMVAMRAAAEADNDSLLSRLGRKGLSDTVVGADAGLRSVMERVELVARSDVPVLILGETGTGKELIARLIHTRSRRSSGPFLRVNCGAIPIELVDSQLFGHEKGAFTGAVESRQGWFERANGGTLLLDEIGELPLAAQVRLLRILQDGWFERVGSHSPVHVDVRIVAATHRDLASMVAGGKFREDLWYRMAVFPVLMPPLRDRREDIPDLARHFAERAAVRFTLPVALPTPEDIRLLQAYAWPGNIRELGAVIDRAAILGDGQRLEIAKALGAGTSHVSAYSPTSSEPAKPTAPPGRREIVSLDEAMRQHIEAALAATQGRIEGRRGAAALLKINPHTLRARMKKLGIEWSRFRESD